MYALLCCTLIAERSIHSAYMSKKNLEQRPQVSQFQEVTPLSLIPTYTYSSQVPTGLYVTPLKHTLELDVPSIF
jgi:hypothetical protein